MPPEIGILIVDKLDTEAGANLTLVNKTVAGWVAKCLLAKVTRCEVEESAEPLDPADDVAHVQHFISAVTSVAIPSRERAASSPDSCSFTAAPITTTLPST